MASNAVDFSVLSDEPTNAPFDAKNDDFVQWLRTRGNINAENAKKNGYIARKLLKENGGQFPNANAFRKASLWVLDNVKAKGTQRQYLIALMRLAEYYGFEGVEFPLPKVTTRCERYLTVDQMRDVMHQAKNQQDLTIMLVFAKSGMRDTELCELTIGDVDFTQSTILIAHGKGDKERKVDMDAQLTTALEKHLGAMHPAYREKLTNPLFRSRLGLPFNRKAIAAMVGKCGERANIECWPHLFRHSFATECVKNGMSPFVLQKILGHSSLQQKLHYYHHSDQIRKSEYARFAPKL